MSKPLIEQSYETVSLDALTPHPENPRKGNEDVIAESIEAHGFYGAVVAQKSTGYVLAGNHRLLAAEKQGLGEVPVIWLDVDDDLARRILLVDNRTSDLGGYDTAALVEILNNLGDPEEWDGIGYGAADMEQLLIDLAAHSEVTGKNEAGYFENATDPDEEWVGMGEFENEDLRPMRQLIVSFASQEDVDAFARLVDQNITDRTRSIWYPAQEEDRNAHLRYVSAAQ